MHAQLTARSARGSITLGLALLTLTGCTATPEPSSSAPADSTGLQTVVMTQAPLTAYGPIWVADEKGFFAEEGIEIEFADAVPSGTEQIAMITSGAADVITTTPSEIIKAKAQGLDTQLIVAVQQNAETDDADNSALLVLDDSTITRLRDLNGKTVAVVGINSQEDMKVKAAIDADGGDSSTVTFIQSPPDAMAGLLETGEVDAIAENQPVASQLLSTGDYTRVSGVVWQGLGGTPGISIISTPDWTGAHGDLAEGMRSAIRNAVAWADDPGNKDDLDAIMATHLGADPDAISEMPPEVYGTQITREGLEKVQAALIAYGLLEAEVDLTSMIWE